MHLISQAVGPLQDALKKDEAGGGVCREWVIQWVVGIKSGSDYLKTLLGLGGEVNAQAVSQVVKDYYSMGRPRWGRAKRPPAGGPISCRKARSASSGPAGLHHAMGINLTVGKEAFFDPNLGEFQFFSKRGQMVKFIDEVLVLPNETPNNFAHYPAAPQGGEDGGTPTRDSLRWTRDYAPHPAGQELMGRGT